MGSLGSITDALNCPGVRFSPQSNKCRVWGMLENRGRMPQHLTPRMPLCIIQTNVTHVLVPDRGQIPLTERGIPLPLRSIVAYGEDLQSILREFHDLTSGNLGKCVDHVVTDIPFQHRLTRQQSSPSISPSEESLVLEEINKLVELGWSGRRPKSHI